MSSVQSRIEQKLQSAFTPAALQVTNESHMHSVPPGSETHFKVVVVSEQFAGKRAVARHQAVYRVLEEEVQGPVHALAIHTYTPDEWAANQAVAPESPACRGGSKADRH